MAERTGSLCVSGFASCATCWRQRWRTRRSHASGARRPGRARRAHGGVAPRLGRPGSRVRSVARGASGRSGSGDAVGVDGGGAVSPGVHRSRAGPVPPASGGATGGGAGGRPPPQSPGRAAGEGRACDHRTGRAEATGASEAGLLSRGRFLDERGGGRRARRCVRCDLLPRGLRAKAEEGDRGAAAAGGRAVRRGSRTENRSARITHRPRGPPGPGPARHAR